ncbi:MAG: hypothetical protein LBU85_02010 [Treponema sp.]|jgi:hypothetical protein|nr:hypothetical protein [Treponema sp.]
MKKFVFFVVALLTVSVLPVWSQSYNTRILYYSMGGVEVTSNYNEVFVMEMGGGDVLLTIYRQGTRSQYDFWSFKRQSGNTYVVEVINIAVGTSDEVSFSTGQGNIGYSSATKTVTASYTEWNIIAIDGSRFIIRYR